MNNYPIILAHGIARFDIIREAVGSQLRGVWADFDFATDELHYFRNIRSHLHRHRFTVYHTNVAFAGGLAQRAQDLGQAIRHIIDQTNANKVHIIGHSMGGLDARHMLFHNHSDVAPHVASLTSIGTPHLGTSFADWGVAQGGDLAIDLFRQLFNLSLDGFRDLTQAARQQANSQLEPFEATNPIFYQAYGSAQQLATTFALMHGAWQIIRQLEGQDRFQGQNDGLVSLQSQLWQSELRSPNGQRKTIPQQIFPMPADHLNQLGWWDLNEMSAWRWWKPQHWWPRWRFETAVKRQYLTIANSLRRL